MEPSFPRVEEKIQGLLGPPPFLTKTYDMVDDRKTNDVVSWSRGGQSFVVWDPYSFSTTLLPNYFKHNNFSSFVRQLNTYGFRKIDPDKWEFVNEAFLEGQKHLLKNIRRRKTPCQSLPPQHEEPCVQVTRFRVDGEIDRLRCDKHVLMMELVKLRQQQQNARACLQHMELKLQGTERKQQQMMSFLARAMQNPEFIHQLVQHKKKRRELGEAVSKKRHRTIEYGGESSITNKGKNPIKAEPLELGESSDPYLQVSELEALALEMQGFGKAKWEHEDADKEELDDGFWEELLNERFDQELGMSKNDEEEEDVNFLGLLDPQMMLWFCDKKYFQH